MDDLSIIWTSLSYGRGEDYVCTCDTFVMAASWHMSDIRTRNLDQLEVETVMWRIGRDVSALEEMLTAATMHLYWTLVRANPWVDQMHPKAKKQLLDLLAKVKSMVAWFGDDVSKFTHKRKSVTSEEQEGLEDGTEDMAAAGKVGLNPEEKKELDAENLEDWT